MKLSVLLCGIFLCLIFTATFYTAVEGLLWSQFTLMQVRILKYS